MINPHSAQCSGSFAPKADGSFTQFSIGNEYSDKEVFVEHITKQVTELRTLATAEEDPSLIEEISLSEEWARIHVRAKGDS